MRRFAAEKSSNFGKFNIQKLFSLTKNRKKPKIEVHCTQQVYWSNSAWDFFIFPQSQMSY